jgi:hypothetical protein
MGRHGLKGGVRGSRTVLLPLVANEDELSLQNFRIFGLTCHDRKLATTARANVIGLVQNVLALHDGERRLLAGTVPGLGRFRPQRFL